MKAFICSQKFMASLAAYTRILHKIFKIRRHGYVYMSLRGNWKTNISDSKFARKMSYTTVYRIIRTCSGFDSNAYHAQCRLLRSRGYMAIDSRKSIRFM